MKKNIALVSHDARKKDMVEWVKHNIEILSPHNFYCTGTTGRLVNEVFVENDYDTKVVRLESGPLGGDQQIGAMICEGKIDMLIFFVDNLSMQPHDVDIKALTRLTQMYNIPSACNRSSADFLITSPLFNDPEYTPVKIDFSSYINRNV